MTAASQNRAPYWAHMVPAPVTTSRVLSDPASVLQEHPSGVVIGDADGFVGVTLIGADGVQLSAELSEAAFDALADILADLIMRRTSAARGRLEGARLQ
jgi:hypothetical protein